MTFSLLGRCTRTGHLGAVTATADIAVGARVPHARPGVGAVLTQHRTDPRLGPRGLDLLASGCDAAETVDGARGLDRFGRLAPAGGDRRSRPHRRVLGRAGGRAVRRGARPPVHRPRQRARVQKRRQGHGGRVRGRSRRSTRRTPGVRAGSRPRLPAASARRCARPRCWSPATSSFALVDLRVDDAPAPIAALRALWEAYRPRVDEFVDRAIDPDSVP